MKIIRGSEITFVPAAHEAAESPGVLKRVLARRDDLLDGRVQMVNWSLLPRGSSFQAHYHEDMQEVFVIVNGRVTMTVDGAPHEIAGGDAILIEPNEVHQMQNICDEEVEYVVFGISLQKGGRTIVVGCESSSISE